MGTIIIERDSPPVVEKFDEVRQSKAITYRQSINSRAYISKQLPKVLSNLAKCAHGEIELRPDQLAAAKLLLDRALPSLQAIEITQDTEIPQDEASMVARLNQLLAALPAEVRQAMGAPVTPVESKSIDMVPLPNFSDENTELSNNPTDDPHETVED